MSRRAAREAAAPAKRGRRPRPESTAGPNADPNADPDAPKPTGIGALFANHRNAWLIGAGAVVFLLLGSGAVFAGVSVGSAAAPAPSPTPTVEPQRDLPDGDLVASRLRTCSIAGLAADPRLMTVEAQVVRDRHRRGALRPFR